MTDEPRHDDLLTKKEVKERFGFTETMVKNLLPAPIEKTNPYYKSGPTMKLWPLETVEAIMETDAFKEAKEKADRRRESSARAVKTKREKTRQQVDQAIARIRVKHKSRLATYDKALAAGARHKEELEHARGDIYYVVDGEVPDATLERWAVNYIRHELTDYEEGLFEMKGKVGTDEEYVRYRDAVLDAIARAYPFLREECERQKIPKWDRLMQEMA